MRNEADSMGTMQVPENALYGASTQRAVLNFPISGHRLPSGFISGLGLIKYAAAKANVELGRLDPKLAELICEAATVIYEGKLDEQFPVDVFQTGSGTSSNMNVNEVISNWVCQKVGKPIGAKDPIHPNDHVNMGQSSNDIIPTVLHISVAVAIKTRLMPALLNLKETLDAKVVEFADVMKIGRTHLMDATPLTLGQEFSGYAAQIKKSLVRAQHCVDVLSELAIGGTAVGTGINCHPEFPKKVCMVLAKMTGINFYEAHNHFEAQGARDDAVEVAGELATIAASFTKIANDIRLMGSGPRAGIFEINLPATQPGSSIMPGKVNPVMSEMLVQASIYTMGCSNMVAMCGRDGHFELNVTIPLMAHALHESVTVLANGANTFAKECVKGLTANKERCNELVGRSLMLVTALNSYIGYDKAAWVAKTALKENKTLKEVILENKVLDVNTGKPMEAATLDVALDPRNMTSSKE